MISQSNIEQATEIVSPTAPGSTKSPEAKSDRPAKAKKKKDDKIFPKKLKAAGNPGSKSVDHEFSGRIEKTSIKDIAPGRRQIGFSITGKKGDSRPYLIEVSEAAADMAIVNLLMAVFAAKRKVKVTTAPHTDGSLRIVEVEVRK
jgi:hypothetical protein